MNKKKYSSLWRVYVSELYRLFHKRSFWLAFMVLFLYALARHHREEDYKELAPADVAYYDGCVYVDLSTVKPMIALPFHPSNTYEIDELKASLNDILGMVEAEAAKVSGGKASFTLRDKIQGGQLHGTAGSHCRLCGRHLFQRDGSCPCIKGKELRLRRVLPWRFIRLHSLSLRTW